ncbi:MAG: GNAT family N-acetyltransferase [Thiobacillaceae bacterium]
MLSIRPPVECDIESVCALARIVWQATYPALISQAQIDFMLADRYAAASIRDQINDPSHVWRLALWDAGIIGFAHASIDALGVKLDKLYIAPSHQQRGIGRALLDDIKRVAHDHTATRLWLQVNRGNTCAIAAYQTYGFTTRAAQVFDIGGGFVMDDYVMDMPL